MELEKFKIKNKKLEIEYRAVKEKQKLIKRIKTYTKQPVGGTYSLTEISGILKIPKEQVKKIESKIEKLLKNPKTARKLRSYTKD